MGARILLAGVMVVGLAACGGDSTSRGNSFAYSNDIDISDSSINMYALTLDLYELAILRTL